MLFSSNYDSVTILRSIHKCFRKLSFSIPFLEWCVFTLGICQEIRKNQWKENDKKQPPEVFCKKRCSQNFAKFTGKHLVPKSLF